LHGEAEAGHTGADYKDIGVEIGHACGIDGLEWVLGIREEMRSGKRMGDRAVTYT
jgi:hypothetical protein